MQYLGDFLEDATVYIPFNTFSSNDPQASVTITNLVDADIMVHKDGGATQIVTDGATVAIDFDTITGNHLITVDTSASADYAIGSDYQVRIEGTTVDGGTINAWVGYFSIENRSSSLNATALAALEDQFDGTGIDGDNYPATQSQLSGLSIASAAASVKCKASPDGFVLTTGSEVNTEDSTFALDGTRHELTDSAGTLDCYYKFDIGAFGLPVSVTFEAVINGGNDTFTFYANTGSSGTPVWSERQTVTGTGSASNASVSVPLFEDDVVSDITNETWIRIAGTGLTSASFDTDFLLLSRSIQAQYSGYDNGAIWGDTVDGTAGTTAGYNGIASRPSDSLANLITLSTNVGLDKFELSGDSIITFTEAHTDEVWNSPGGTLALGGQDCSSSTFEGWNSVSGIATMASGEAHFIECEIDNATVGNSHFKKTGFGGTLTLGAATDYFLVDCYSQVAGATSPIIDMGAAIGATNVSIRRWSGGLTINNLAAGDVVTLDGIFGTITLNGADATVEIRGIAKAVDQTGLTGATVSDDTLKTDIQEDWTNGGRLDVILDSVLADTNELQTDWTDGGRLDLLLDRLITELDTARGEPAQGAPAASTKIGDKIDYLYKAWRNKTEQTATTLSIYDDAGTTVDHKSTVSDDATTATRGEIVTGP